MENLFIVARLFEWTPPACLVIGLFGTIALIFLWVFADIEDEKEMAKKWTRIIVIFFLSSLPLAVLSYLPQAVIKGRIDMIKYEITSPEVRKAVYEDLDRLFEKLEDKYLGEEESNGK